MGCWGMQKLWINADGGRWYSNAIGCDFRQICTIWKTGKIQKFQPKSPTMTLKWPVMVQNWLNCPKIDHNRPRFIRKWPKFITELALESVLHLKNYAPFYVKITPKFPKFWNFKRASTTKELKMPFSRRESRQWF